MAVDFNAIISSVDQSAIIFSPSDLIEVLNQTLDYAYPGVEIEGEIASYKVNQNKYVFFDLKDEAASVNCFMSIFYLRQPLKDGMRVRAHARPQITKWGKFSLVVDRIIPVGEGSIKQAQTLLQEKLTKEGLFDVARKRSLPILPELIGVISSEQAAGYADFSRILDDRWGGLNILFRHTQVQGEVAADQIIAAIEYFNQIPNSPELIVVIRGGGSADDLACFNDEKLVRTIVSSRIPVLTGIGHETDESLSDLAADVAAATPSHAAQLIVPERQSFIDQWRDRLMAVRNTTLEYLSRETAVVEGMMRDVAQHSSSQLQLIRERVAQVNQLLESYDPERVLERGYAILRGQANTGALVEIETKQHVITAEVKNVQKR